MRCHACQVDLDENVMVCPLCGGPAEDAAPLMEGVARQDYPVYESERRCGLTLREKLKAILHF